MGVDATSKQTGGKDCRLEGGGLYYHTFMAEDGRVLALLAKVAWRWYGLDELIFVLECMMRYLTQI